MSDNDRKNWFCVEMNKASFCNAFLGLSYFIVFFFGFIIKVDYIGV